MELDSFTPFEHPVASLFFKKFPFPNKFCLALKNNNIDSTF